MHFLFCAHLIIFIIFLGLLNLDIITTASPLGCLHYQGSHRLEKYLNLEGFLEKSLKIISALRYWKSLKSIEQSLNSSIFCRTFKTLMTEI